MSKITALRRLLQSHFIGILLEQPGKIKFHNLFRERLLLIILRASGPVKTEADDKINKTQGSGLLPMNTGLILR